MLTTTEDIKALTQRCAQGEVAARVTFQEEFGPLIYSFPVRMFHLPEADAGEFYLYAFEESRIFRRLQTFEGRNAIQFTNYLSFYVLRDLLLEWLRSRRDVESVSLDTASSPGTTEPDAPQTLGQRLAINAVTPEEMFLNAEACQTALRALEGLDPEKRLLLKLLSLDVVDLQPNDIRLITQVSGRGISETLKILADVEEAVEERGSRHREQRDKLAGVSAWIIAYQRRLKQLEGLPRSARPERDRKVGALQKEREELERKLAWRYRQQATLRREAMGNSVHPSYKDIARLLNWPMGTVCSRIARAREELWRALMELSSTGPMAGEGKDALSHR